jgi:ABC-type uncharacterized transport system permease subunit
MKLAFNAALILMTVLETVLLMAYARVFTRGREGVGKATRWLLVAAVLGQSASIGLRSALLKACPLLAWSDILAVVAFSVLVMYLLLELRLGERSTGVFAITPALLLHIVAAVAMLEASPPASATLGLWEALHVFSAVVGFSAVALCGVYGLLYLFLYTAIKRGRFGLFYRKMPPLESLSSLNSAAAAMAFVALTASLGLGILVQRSMAGGASFWTRPEVLMVCVLWLLYGGALLWSRVFGLGGKRFAYTTTLGLVVLFGILIWGLLRHSFHG